LLEAKNLSRKEESDPELEQEHHNALPEAKNE
jgi:hypothetical protein